MFKDDWETIMGTCGLRVYLGGEEQSTHESISKQLGKTTIHYDTYGKSDKNLSTNINLTGRELMTPDEVRRLRRSECLVFIESQDPVKDKKYDLMTHPQISQTADGGTPKYVFQPKNPAEKYFSTNEYEYKENEEN